MGKKVIIAEKPSVAREFAKVLNVNGVNKNGYIEGEDTIVTWCVGHLVTMSYPEVYDSKLKYWRLSTLPFIPKEFKYEVIDNVKQQFDIVSQILNREDVDCIYVCTDSGREGEYIYRLVEQEAHVEGKTRKRVWIDSQTEEEILRGIRERLIVTRRRLDPQIERALRLNSLESCRRHYIIQKLSVFFIEINVSLCVDTSRDNELHERRRVDHSENQVGCRDSPDKL